MAAIEAPDDDVELRLAVAQLVNPPRVEQKTRALVVSFAAFVLAMMAQGTTSVVAVAMLVGVILAHELGHAVAMVVVGYRDVRVFFIPFFGGAAAGRKIGVAAWKQAIVLLAGPLPGIVAGSVLLAIGVDGVLRVLALELLVINALNLLPAAPLDGGRLFQLLVFSRRLRLELAFLGASAIVIAVGALWARFYVLAAIGGVMILGFGQRRRVLEAAQRLRGDALPEDPAALDDGQQRTLHRAMWAALPASWHARWRGNAPAQAAMMGQILERATQRPASGRATVAALGAWLVALALAGFGLWSVLVPHWQRYTFVDLGFSIELPVKPERRAKGNIELVVAKVRGGQLEVAVTSLDGGSPEEWYERMREAKLADTVVERTDDPRRLMLRTKQRDGKRATHLIRMDSDGTTAYVVDYGTHAAVPDADAVRMVDSFRLLREVAALKQ